MKKLYIVDAVNLLFRSYYAIGPMTNPQGESTNALFGFIRSLYKLIAEFKPDYLVAVFDGPDNKKMRTALYAEYKSHRKAMPEDLYPQLEKALYWCEIAGIPFLSVPGVEADDTMGSIAVWAEKKDVDVFLCSSDKDLCQLIDDKIFMIQLHKDNMIVDKKKVEELYGITPKQMVDYLAIVGDASDNIPGLEGFGPKTAAALLQEFGTLDEILTHPEKVPGAKKQETIRQGKEIALLSRQLATIHKEVDFPKEDEFFRLKHPTVEVLQAFYQEMHFMTLLKEMEVQTVKADTSNYHLVNDLASLEKLMEKLQTEAEICLDTETTNIKPMLARLVGVGLSIGSGSWYIPFNGAIPSPQIKHHLEKLLLHPHLSFYGHNIKYDLHVLENEELPTPYVSFDTMVASYLLTPQSQRHGLDAVALERLRITKIPISDLIGKGSKQISMNEVPIEKVSTYCCEDVDCTVQLKKIFEKELEEHDLIPVFTTIEMPLIPVLAAMERRGIYVDQTILSQMSKELAHKIQEIEKQIFAIAGEEFNISSPKQLSKILFEKLKITPPKKQRQDFQPAPMF